MTHDPLCPNFHLEDDCTCEPRNGEHDMKCACWECECDIIAKVRADERGKLVEVMGQVSHQNADQGNRVIVFAGKPVNGSVLVWQDGQYVWANPR